MISIKRLLSALCLALCYSYSSAQVSTTGELIQNDADRWSGCYTPTQSGFWGGTSGGPCPGLWDNNIEYNGNQIIFSYGQYTLTQTVDLPTVLPNSGTGLQVNGYNWHWHVKNSNINGNQPGNYDPIAYIDVTLYNTDGTIAIKDTYDYGYHIPSWIAPSGTRTYAQPYSLEQVDTMTLSVTGKDSGYWAGYYGPEFMHFSLTVNYSVDPCYDNPLWSSSCPGYLEAFQAIMAQATPEESTEDYSLTSIASPSLSAMPEESTTGEVKVDAGGIEVSTSGELSVPDGIPEEVKEKKSVDMNLISKIVKEATDDSQVLAVVNQSIQQSMGEDANPDFTGTKEALQAIQQQSEKSQEAAMQDSQLSDLLQLQAETSITERQDITITEETETQIEIQTTQSMENKSQATNDVDITKQNMISVEDKKDNKKEVTVKQNVEPNEAASGSDIADIAVSPIGFNDYLTKSLIDAQFYQDKEIYAGQTVVDNRRAQRLLNGASDRLHREMVDQQYRRQ